MLFIIVFLLVTACFATFGRIANNGFINYDDGIYLLENSHIQSGISMENIRWAFTTFESSNWHPLTWLSHMLDWKLFGANAGGHHWVSLLFHIGSVIFLFLFLFKTTNSLWPAAFAAALFALHPLRVQSVAWAAERKDVLSMFFGMAALYAYASYAMSSKKSSYFLCLALFAFALMSKSMLVTLPFVFLLLDYWPLGRLRVFSESAEGVSKTIGKLLEEKIPFFALSLASCVITLWAQWETSVENLPFSLRVINATIAYTTYLVKTFFPINLAVYYPFVGSFPLWKILGSLFILTAITLGVIFYLKKLPFLFVGWFWYLGTLIPVSGLVSVNAPMADHYTYLPSVGIAIMISWGLHILTIRNESRQKIWFAGGITVLCLFSILTFRQCGYWKNSISLFHHALKVTKNNDLAHNNLASALFYEGKINEALEHFSQAIAIAPGAQMPYYNRGTLYAQQGLYQQAVDDFTRAISLLPKNVQAYNNRGVVLTKMGLYQKALDDFNEAIRLKPDLSELYNNRAVVYFKQNNFRQGCTDVKKACELGNCRKFEVAQRKGFCR